VELLGEADQVRGILQVRHRHGVIEELGHLTAPDRAHAADAGGEGGEYR
jgi:hypothetical protein